MLTRAVRNALAVGAAGVLLGGCASPSSPSGVAAAPTALSADAAAFFSQSDATQASLAGTPADRSAADLAAQVKQQQGTATCMRVAGFEYDVPNVVASRQDQSYVPAWWATPSLTEAAKGLGYAVAAQPVPSAKPNSYQALSRSGKAAYDAALDGCLASTSSRPKPLNQTAASLQTALIDTLMTAAGKPEFAAVRAQYASCMAADGIEVKEPGDLFSVAEQRLGATGLFNMDPYSSAYTAALPQAKRTEVDLTTADVQCRAPIAAAIAAQLAPVLTAWLSANQARLQAAASAWKAAGTGTAGG